MIDFYYWMTPNGHKVSIFLEEVGLDYRVHPINIGKGEQFDPDFLKISPNNRIPAIQDGELSVFESGAILTYLAEKTGRFLPKSGEARYKVLEWLFWQMGGLGPMAGQNHHFSKYADQKITYAIDRYVNETHRLYGVLNKNLSEREFVAGAEYCIADMAIYPWIVPYQSQGQDLNEFPHLNRWFEQIRMRPAVQRAYAMAEKFKPSDQGMTEEAKKILFGQKAR